MAIGNDSVIEQCWQGGVDFTFTNKDRQRFTDSSQGRNNGVAKLQSTRCLRCGAHFTFDAEDTFRHQVLCLQRLQLRFIFDDDLNASPTIAQNEKSNTAKLANCVFR
jgi:hypothetical protein